MFFCFWNLNPYIEIEKVKNLLKNSIIYICIYNALYQQKIMFKNFNDFTWENIKEGISN